MMNYDRTLELREIVFPVYVPLTIIFVKIVLIAFKRIYLMFGDFFKFSGGGVKL